MYATMYAASRRQANRHGARNRGKWLACVLCLHTSRTAHEWQVVHGWHPLAGEQITHTEGRVKKRRGGEKEKGGGGRNERLLSSIALTVALI